LNTHIYFKLFGQKSSVSNLFQLFCFTFPGAGIRKKTRQTTDRKSGVFLISDPAKKSGSQVALVPGLVTTGFKENVFYLSETSKCHFEQT